jgi:hypothetical protein
MIAKVCVFNLLAPPMPIEEGMVPKKESPEKCCVITVIKNLPAIAFALKDM